MLETIVNIAAIFGAFWFIFLAYIGFRVAIHSFAFAAQVGLASARASMIARSHADVQAKFAEEAAKDDEKDEAPVNPVKPKQKQPQQKG